MDRIKEKAFKELVNVIKDQGQAGVELANISERMEINQLDMEALMDVLAGQKANDDFLSRKEASNDDATGGDDE